MDAELSVRTWREAAPRLEAIRREGIRRTDHVRDVGLFEGVFEYSLAHIPYARRRWYAWSVFDTAFTRLSGFVE